MTLTASATNTDGHTFSHWADSTGTEVGTTAIFDLTVGNKKEIYSPVYMSPYSEGLAFTSNGDGTCYVSGIGTCDQTVIVIPTVSPVGDRVTGIGYNAFRDTERCQRNWQ